MTLFVDTSVWSLAFRRDAVSPAPEMRALRDALEGGETIVTTGLILQELLQGFAGPRARKDIIDRFTALPLLTRTGRITSTPRNCAIVAGARACRLAPSTPCSRSSASVIN